MWVSPLDTKGSDVFEGLVPMLALVACTLEVPILYPPSNNQSIDKVIRVTPDPWKIQLTFGMTLPTIHSSVNGGHVIMLVTAVCHLPTHNQSE